MKRMNLYGAGWLQAVFVSLLLLGGCAAKPDQGPLAVVSADFFGFGEDLSRQLVDNMREGGHNGERLIVSTFVDLDDLYESTGFGRTLTEALSTCLFRRGFRIAEIRKAEELMFRDQVGELTLSRDVALLARGLKVQAILTGTYSLTPTTVIVNVKLLEAGSQEVLSVAGLEIERSANINYLLSRRGGDMVIGTLSAYER